MFREPIHLLLLLAGLFWTALLARRVISDLRRRREAFAAREMLRRISGHQATRRPVVKWLMMILGLALLGIGLARPTGGSFEEAVSGRGMDVVVALDVSTSMKAPDIDGNSRLDVAKALIQRLLGALGNDRVGLVAFAGDTMVQCPLTPDKGTFLTFLQRVDPAMLTVQGTNLAAAVETALDRFDYTASRTRVIVLVSDGEDRDPKRVDRAVADAGRRGIPVYTVGIGSLEGSYLPEGRDVWGRLIYKTFKGERVVTKLDDTMLRRIARDSRGAYFRAQDVSSARSVAAALESLPRTSIHQGSQTVTRELFQWPVLLAFLLLLVEWMVSERIPYEREKDHWLKRL